MPGRMQGWAAVTMRFQNRRMSASGRSRQAYAEKDFPFGARIESRFALATWMRPSIGVRKSVGVRKSIGVRNWVSVVAEHGSGSDLLGQRSAPFHLGEPLLAERSREQ